MNAPTARASLDPHELKTGDVLLESVPCYICSLIEIEEGEPYSHMGVILKVGDQINVLMSWQSVVSVPLDSFLNLRKIGSATLALRPIRLDSHEINFDPKTLQAVFEKEFQGLDYDEDFLWNNYDSKGQKLYCSEFVTKFLNPFLPDKIPTKPMHFNQYREAWVAYFHGNVPDGLPGNSPGDFAKSNLFKKLGSL